MSRAEKKYMLLAIDEARKNIRRKDGGPFGACIVKGNKVIAAAKNTVFRDDATAHAEMNAIRLASKKLKTFDLSGCLIYSTTEPCPMCFGAIHWARIAKIIYGTRIADALRCGFHELCISSAAMKKAGKSPVSIVPGFMRAEAFKLFKEWSVSSGMTY